MGGALAGRKVAILGGDERELFLLKDLLENNIQVNAIGFDEVKTIPSLKLFNDIKIAINDTSAIILPMTGMDDKGFVKTVFSKTMWFCCKNKMKNGQKPYIILGKYVVLLIQLKLCTYFS